MVSQCWLRVEGMDQKTWTLYSVGPWNLMRISFFFKRSEVLKRKLAITYSSIWDGAHLILLFPVGISYANITERKVGFCCFT